MSAISSKDTSQEISVRKYLFSKGFRYRKNVAGLPGKPDIVLKKYKVVLFIHGCFWHGHKGCKKSALPKTNNDFWESKIYGNTARDRIAHIELKRLGWKVITVWQCEISNEKKFASRLKAIENSIITTIKTSSNDRTTSSKRVPNRRSIQRSH